MQKLVRYYIAERGVKIFKCNPDGREIQIELKDKAYALGLTHAEIARQIRQGYFGGYEKKSWWQSLTCSNDARVPNPCGTHRARTDQLSFQ